MFKRPALLCIVIFLGIISWLFGYNQPLPLAGADSFKNTRPLKDVTPTTSPGKSIENAFNPVVRIYSGSKHASGFFIRIKGELKVVTAAHCVGRFRSILPKNIDLHGMEDEFKRALPSIRVTARINNLRFTSIAHPRWIGIRDFAILSLKDPRAFDDYYNSKGIEVTTVVFPSNIDAYIKDYFSEVITVGYPLHLRTRIITRGTLGPPNELGLPSITSPVMKGNSGGPVIRADTMEVIGLVSTMAVADFVYEGVKHRQYISHLGFMVSFDHVMKAIEKMESRVEKN